MKNNNEIFWCYYEKNTFYTSILMLCCLCLSSCEDKDYYKIDMNTIKVYDVQGWKTLSPSSTLNLILNNENFQPLIIKQVEKEIKRNKI